MPKGQANKLGFIAPDHLGAPHIVTDARLTKSPGPCRGFILSEVTEHADVGCGTKRTSRAGQAISAVEAERKWQEPAGTSQFDP